MKHSLKDLSMNITEPEYRSYSALNYSLISTFYKVGYDMEKLCEKQESDSLTYGSIVDTLLTEGIEAFNEKYYVIDNVEPLSDKLNSIVGNLFSMYGNVLDSLTELGAETLNKHLVEMDFYPNQIKVPSKRIEKFFGTSADTYFKEYKKANGRRIITRDYITEITERINTIRESEATKMYFSSDTGNIERYYQLKFTADLSGIQAKCMFDLIIVDHDNKRIIPVDLKTSLRCPEEEFYTNFVYFNYQMEARWYTRILCEVISKDPYYKDFEVCNFRFVFSNKETNNPLVWEYEDSLKTGTLYYGRYKHICMPDPLYIAKDLRKFLDTGQVPERPEILNRNSIVKHINLM